MYSRPYLFVARIFREHGLKVLCQDLLAFPSALLCDGEEIHVAIHQMRSMVREEYKDTRWLVSIGRLQGETASVQESSVLGMVEDEI